MLVEYKRKESFFFVSCRLCIKQVFYSRSLEVLSTTKSFNYSWIFFFNFPRLTRIYKNEIVNSDLCFSSWSEFCTWWNEFFRDKCSFCIRRIFLWVQMFIQYNIFYSFVNKYVSNYYFAVPAITFFNVLNRRIQLDPWWKF